MLGVPPQTGDLFRRWIHELFELGITDRNAMERAVAEIRAFFAAEIAERRKMPRDDLISYLVEARIDGQKLDDEHILSLGAINTPKVLMQSGIGNEAILRRFGIPIVQHLPGVGQNYQDHIGIGCVWEYPQRTPPRNNAGEMTIFWKSHPGLESPDIQICQAEVPIASAETAATFNPPSGSWTMFGGVVRPMSRGQLLLTGPGPLDPVLIETNMLSHPDDLRAAKACVELCREIANAPALRPFVKREVVPGNLKGLDLENFIRDAAITYHHQSCTAKNGARCDVGRRR